MRVLVTGGAGFIGSHSVDLLLKEGWQVTVYDNLISGKLENLNLFHPNLTVVQADILNYDKLLSEISNCDAVLHLAALSSIPKSIENPVNSLHVNVQGFLHILQAVRELDKRIRIVYASSAAVYGSVLTLPCCDESTIVNEVLSPYALEKINNESYANLYMKLFNIQSLGLRYFNVYGERQDPSSLYSGVISKFIKSYKANDEITVFGDGTQSRDFITVNDVAYANLCALTSGYTGVVNVATGTAETLLDLVRYIENIGGKPAKLSFKNKREGDIYQSCAAVEKAKRYLNFHSRISLAKGIESLLNLPNE